MLSQTIRQNLPISRYLIAAITLIALSFATGSAFAASGTWSKKSFNINGGWSITERNGAQVLQLDSGFRTKSAPDLKLFLSTRSLTELNGRNATSGAILISPLQSNSGAQEYVIPAGVDLSQFQTLIIHCEAYSKLWGGSHL